MTRKLPSDRASISSLAGYADDVAEIGGELGLEAVLSLPSCRFAAKPV
jgi:hypothetical protein